MSTRVVSKLIPTTVEALDQEYNSLVTGLGLQGTILHTEEVNTAVDLITTVDSTNTATAVTLANAMRTWMIAHVASTAKHVAADATNVVTSAVATDQTTLNTLANEIKTDFNAHQILAAAHRGIGGAGSPAAAPAAVATADSTDQTTGVALTNALKAALNLHVSSGAQNIVRNRT